MTLWLGPRRVTNATACNSSPEAQPRPSRRALRRTNRCSSLETRLASSQGGESLRRGQPRLYQMKSREIMALEESLGHQFQRRELLEQALTHSSQAREVEALSA